MTRSRLLLGVAAVLAGATVLFVVLGAAFNLVLVGVALPFGVAAYLLWAHATGRLQARIRSRVVEREAFERARRDARSARRTVDDGGASTRRRAEDDRYRRMGRREALAALDLPPDADQPAIRRAYRNRVKAVHPDAEGGDEDEFRRVRAAYERLRTAPQGKR